MFSFLLRSLGAVVFRGLRVWRHHTPVFTAGLTTGATSMLGSRHGGAAAANPLCVQALQRSKGKFRQVGLSGGVKLGPLIRSNNTSLAIGPREVNKPTTTTLPAPVTVRAATRSLGETRGVRLWLQGWLA